MVAATILTGMRGFRPIVVGFLALSWFALACAQRVGPGGAPEPGVRTVEPLRLTEVARDGDPTRRASTRLVIMGLSARPPERGVADFERAIQIDATNPWAYLALAAYEVQWGDVSRGVQSLAQSEVLLESQGFRSPRVEPHLIGLRGRAKLREIHGDSASSGEALLNEARAMAPDVWGDGWLGASELQ